MNKELERQSRWNEFLEAWPIERLSTMSLEDYTSQGTNNSFCYWLESRTENLGSIWGGSAFKFGIYQRKDRVAKENTSGRCYTSEYGWYEKYGDTPESAFEAVRCIIVNIAEAARRGDLMTVQNADLGEAVRWKVAFLYQNIDQLSILPIYKTEMLKVLVDQANFDVVQAYQSLLSEQGELPLFEFSENLWTRATKIIAQQFTPKVAEEYFNRSDDYEAIKEPTKKLAGYRTLSGKHIALRRSGIKNASLYLSAGVWLEEVKSDAVEYEAYDANKSRSSNIAANAPKLAIGNPIIRVTVDSLDALERVCFAYENNELRTQPPISEQPYAPLKEAKMNFPLNQILYGPPGVGKTYSTVEMAVQIAEPEKYSEITKQYSGGARRNYLKALYDQLIEQERVVFTTFHQSFSYEDFIEGIRAKTNQETKQIEYEIEDGIFKRISEQATKSVAVATDLGLSESPTLWKISIARTNEAEMRNRYIEAGEARIGWNNTGDLTQAYDDRSESEQKYWDSLSAKNHSAINAFANDLQVGDVVLCLKDATTVQAVGIVQSEYYFDTSLAKNSHEYAHVRKVNWILKNIKLDILPLNGGKRLVQQTFYPLSRISWNKLINELPKQNIQLPVAPEQSNSSNYVLIIDEINRGNISRIFGELITLLETDKRAGGSDERTVTLPYSKTLFNVPDNLYVLGTMNTADKSLAQLDLALRRRFEFREIMPDTRLLDGVEVYGISIQRLLDVINNRIEVLLDRDHLIGHSYFFSLKNATESKETVLAHIFEKRIIPLLQEYFFSDWERIGWVLNDIEKPYEDRFIQLQNESFSLNSFFSPKVIDHLQDRRYVINYKAFLNSSSYVAILPKD